MRCILASAVSTIERAVVAADPAEVAEDCAAFAAVWAVAVAVALAVMAAALVEIEVAWEVRLDSAVSSLVRSASMRAVMVASAVLISACEKVPPTVGGVIGKFFPQKKAAPARQPARANRQGRPKEVAAARTAAVVRITKPPRRGEKRKE